MNFEETLEFLYGLLPVYHRSGSANYKIDLNRTLELSAALGEPHKNLVCLHVAGTNGKGSVSAMLSAVLQKAGFRVGLMTSPHLICITERLKINGEPIPKETLRAVVEQNLETIERIRPSFFELITIFGFGWFKQNHTDIAVIETGLGGRLDSTNIISPIVSVITNIAYDHAEFLGKTLPEIAQEKAGILKPQTPCIIGEYLPETLPIFQQTANGLNASLFFAQDEYQLRELSADNFGRSYQVKRSGLVRFAELICDLAGRYQSCNLAAALLTLDVMRDLGWQIAEEAIIQGLAKAARLSGLRGRMETLRERPLILADVAHNEAGIKALTDHLQTLKFERLRIVLGLAKEKELDKIAKLLPKNAVYYFTQANIARALPADELAAKAQNFGLSGKAYPKIEWALSQALRDASEQDCLLITGSIFVVGEALQSF